MSSALLADRAVVAVAGRDAEALLNRLFTNSMFDMAPGAARYAALLSPQGKILFDFLVLRREDDGFWIDCRRDQSAELARKLTMFRLRAQAEVAVEAGLAVAAVWDGQPGKMPGPCFRDPRHDALGHRIVAPPDDLASVAHDDGDYRAHRIALGVPEGGTDWPYGDTFVHDANLDLLHGVDFDKGCYVGQEVVSRVHHRNSARKRIVTVRFLGDPPALGTEMVAGSVGLGQLTSLAARRGLASVRIDRLAEAEAAKAPVTAGDTLVEIGLPVASAVEVTTSDADELP